jgi:predicted RNA-binding protein
MCESIVYILEGEEKKKIMEDVSKVRYEGENLVLIGLLGDRKEIRGKIIEVDADQHEIVIKPE